MNRRDLLKYTLAAPVVGIALKTRYDHYKDRKMVQPKNKRGPVNTDDRIYDELLEAYETNQFYGKDEMHL